jgi:hypothetical protein
MRPALRETDLAILDTLTEATRKMTEGELIQLTLLNNIGDHRGAASRHCHAQDRLPLQRELSSRGDSPRGRRTESGRRWRPMDSILESPSS